MADMKASSRRFIDEAFNKGNLAVVDELIARDIKDHSAPPGVPSSAEGLKQFIRSLRQAFPDLNLKVIHTIAEGDLVVEHVLGSGTMKGDFMGMSATGKKAEWEEIHISRFQDGKAVEHWGVQDRLGMAQQLGVTPAPASAGTRQ